MQVSAAVRKMQEEVEARQRAEAEAARLAEEQRIWVCALITSIHLLCIVSGALFSSVADIHSLPAHHVCVRSPHAPPMLIRNALASICSYVHSLPAHHVRVPSPNAPPMLYQKCLGQHLLLKYTGCLLIVFVPLVTLHHENTRRGSIVVCAQQHASNQIPLHPALSPYCQAYCHHTVTHFYAEVSSPIAHQCNFLVHWLA